MDDWSWLPELDHKPRTWTGAIQRWQLPKSDQVLVYFISAVESYLPDAPIKIGMSAHPLARLAEMQPCCPVPMEILAVCEGGKAREGKYHARFEKHRLHGEWFARSEELMRLVRYHKSRGGRWAHSFNRPALHASA